MAEKEEDPGRKDKLFTEQEQAVTICRDVADGGTLALREKRETYLPRFDRESDRTYNARRRQAVLFNATDRTATGLAGMVTRKPVVLPDELDDRLSADLEDVDLDGRGIDQFVFDVVREIYLDGHQDIVVDMPPPDPDIKTKAQEEASGRRAYWIQVPKLKVLRARTRRIQGRNELVRYAYIEDATEEVGRFSEQEIERVREWSLEVEIVRGQLQRRVFFESWKRKKDEGKFVTDQPRMELPGAPRIPVVTAFGNRRGSRKSKPPLLDLALQNILHFQIGSDRNRLLSISHSPVPVVYGAKVGDETPVSSEHGLSLPKDARFEIVETTGAALKLSAEEMQAIEKRMAMLGLSHLMSESRAAETAESKRIDKSESDASLTSVVNSVERMVNDAIGLHAAWMDVKEPGAKLSLNRDFEAQILSAGQIRELRELWASEAIPIEELWRRLQEGEVLSDSFDADQARVELGLPERDAA